MDTVGPVTKSFSGFQYLLLFICWITRWGEGVPLRDRSAKEVSRAITIVKNRNVAPEILKSDRAREYLAGAVEEVLSETAHELNIRYSHHRMGRSERYGRSVVEGGRTLLIAAAAPATMWTLAVLWFIFVKNRVVHSATGESPFKGRHKREYDLEKLHVFGATVIYCPPPELTNKTERFQPRGIEGRFWGVDVDCGGFIVIPKGVKLELLTSRDIVVTADLKFYDFINPPSIPSQILTQANYSDVALAVWDSGSPLGNKNENQNRNGHSNQKSVGPIEKAQERNKEIDGHHGVFRPATANELKNCDVLNSYILESEKDDHGYLRPKARFVADGRGEEKSDGDTEKMKGAASAKVIRVCLAWLLSMP